MGKRAFTLAEVLITLGIIGVVAALTLPALTAKYQEKVLLTRAKKTYTLILTALNTYKAKNEVSDVSSLFDTNNTSEQTLNNFAKFFKTTEICKANATGCGGAYRIKLTKKTGDGNGNVRTNTLYNIPRMILPDGVLIGITQYSNCHQEYESGKYEYDENGYIIADNSWTRSYCALICFDTNNNQQPNQAGLDYFCFGLRESGNVYDPNTSMTGSITKVLAEDKLNNVEKYNTGKFKE